MDKILATFLNWMKGISKASAGESEMGRFIKALIKAAYFVLAAVGLGQICLWTKEGFSDDDDKKSHHRDHSRGHSSYSGSRRSRRE